MPFRMPVAPVLVERGFSFQPEARAVEQAFTMLDDCKEFNALGTFCEVPEVIKRTSDQPYTVVDCSARSVNGLTCNSVINSKRPSSGPRERCTLMLLVHFCLLVGSVTSF